MRLVVEVHVTLAAVDAVIGPLSVDVVARVQLHDGFLHEPPKDFGALLGRLGSQLQLLLEVLREIDGPAELLVGPLLAHDTGTQLIVRAAPGPRRELSPERREGLEGFRVLDDSVRTLTAEGLVCQLCLSLRPALRLGLADPRLGFLLGPLAPQPSLALVPEPRLLGLGCNRRGLGLGPGLFFDGQGGLHPGLGFLFLQA